MTVRYISCTTSDRPYDGLTFINLDGKGTNNDIQFCYGHFENFPIHQVYSKQWIDLLPNQDLKLILYWQQTPVFNDLSLLPSTIKDRINSDPNVYLLCCDLLESVAWPERYTTGCQSENIRLEKVIVLTSNHEINNSCINGIRYFSVEFWESLTRQHFRWLDTLCDMISMDQRQIDIQSSSKKFISLNRNLKAHRIAWKYAMSTSGVQSQGHVSYHLPNFKGYESNSDHDMILRKHCKSWLPDAEIDDIVQHLTPMKLDDLDINHVPISYSDSILSYYRDSLVSFITESHHDSVFLTEKTFKAIIMGHPFFIIGTPEMHARLREKGYHTFENLFGYDKIVEYDQMSSACSKMRDCNINELRNEILQNWMPSIRHNFELFFDSQCDWNILENKIKTQLFS